MYIEPSQECLRLLVGSWAIETKRDRVTIFQLTPSNKLRIRVLDGDLLQVSADLQDSSGKLFLRLIENHLKLRSSDKALQFECRAGRAVVSVPVNSTYLPRWFLEQVAEIRALDEEFATDGRIPMFDIEVLRPGVVKLQGVWADESKAIAITPNMFCFCVKDTPVFTISGHGEETVLIWEGPINGEMIKFGGAQQ